MAVHERDLVVKVDEKNHKYYVRDVIIKSSVTEFIKSYFNVFNGEEICGKMLNNKEFPMADKYSKYRSLPIWSFDGKEIDQWKIGANLTDHTAAKEYIINYWAKSNTSSNQSGTKMHKNIEDYMNVKIQDRMHDVPIKNTSVINDTTNPLIMKEPNDIEPEYKYFQNFNMKMTNLGYIPYKAEQVIWDENLQLAGAVDMMYVKKNELEMQPLPIYLVDWKRSKNIEFVSKYRKKGTGILKNMDDCNGNHYILQLNIYKELLERHYDKKITNMSIVVFHPDNDEYEEHIVPDKKDVILSMFADRLRKIKL